jgi:hypothetical protein
MTHELKTEPEFINAIAAGVKTIDACKDDCDFKVGDTLRYRAYTYHYTGQEIDAEVLCILRGPECGIMPGFCVLAIRPIHSRDDDSQKYLDSFNEFSG